MAIQRSTHPSADVLKAFGLGKLDDSSADVVRNHLDQCEDCRKEVAALAGDDFLVRLYRVRDRDSAVAPARTHAKTARSSPHALGPTTLVDLPPELANHPDYEILREQGRGGMGIVYLSKHRISGRIEVLKVMNKALLGQAENKERFLREIQSAARLDHKNVVKMYTALELGELMVLVMEYVPGEDLAKVVEDRGPLPVLNACYYVQQAASGLQHAFEKGMIHRDIKPQNLILSREGKKHVIKILDFGLAKATRGEDVDAGLTGTGVLMGTPGYVAPEQSLDAARADIRADIYSLGCTLYHLLAGMPPFSGRSVFEILQAHHSVAARPLNLVRSEVPEALAAVVGKMMAKDASQRYQTPIEVVRALDPFVKGTPNPLPQRQTLTKGGQRGASPQMVRETMVEGPATIARGTKAEDPERTRKWLIVPLSFVLLVGMLGVGAALVVKAKNKDENPVVEPQSTESDEKNITSVNAPPGVKDAPKSNSLAQKEPPKTDLELLQDQDDAFRAAMTDTSLQFFRERGPKRVAVWKRYAEDSNLIGMCLYARCLQEGIGVAKDESEAFNWSRKAAEQGNAWGQYNLGSCYYKGIGVTKDEIEAVKWYRKSAEQGNADGQHKLGVCYRNGIGVAKDETEAVKWYRKAIDQGNTLAMNQLGSCYYNGIGVAKDKSKAFQCFRKAADLGNPIAIGFCYHEGVGMAKDEAEAVKWYRKAAEQGTVRGQVKLGWCYETGAGVAKDGAEAVKWYRKAAEQGDDDGQFRLGWCYYEGIGVAKDMAEAVRWYRKAVDQGNANGQNNLGVCYDKGTGVTKDEVEAVKWYRKAAEQENDLGQRNLGFCYQYGTGVAKDEAEAVKWYRKAAEQENAEAQYSLGVCYQNGSGVAKDEAEAVRWFRKAAEHGNALGQYGFGVCYLYGKGVAKDEAEAVKWLRKAAEQENADAQNTLGVCYDNGTGVVKDEAEAVKWYRKAAEQGHADGQNGLGVCYEKGIGVAKDEAEAVRWYRKAAEQGQANAQNSLGFRYQKGIVVAKDEAEAVKWYRKAVAQGDACGQNNLGVCYQNGTGVTKDEVEAVKWYRKAAEQRNADGQYNLGLCYQYGTGVAKDEAEAVRWYRKAADQGYGLAIQVLAAKAKN